MKFGFLIEERARYLKQYLFFVCTQHIPLFLSIMLNWSIEDNLTLCNTNQDIENLTNKDVILFMGGTNDVHTNNSINGLRYISQFVNKNTQTNIIRSTTSHRYNHSDTSNINNEVKKFNRKLHKYVKLNTHVTIIDVDQNGIFY